MGFEVLLYTDCAAHESVNGRTGFQFMAESPGVTPSDEEFVKSSGLHVVPNALPAEEPETHPPTCVYRELAGRHYLSRGRSTGTTLTGRPGNQVTQAIVSSETADVLPLRPAQLYSCPEWQLDRATRKELAPWQTPLEIAPEFETAALHEMLAGDPWARDLLPSFLTMVEQATAVDRRKLIIKHPNQSLVMRWIALASLFLDSGAALTLTFRVFSPNPGADLLAVVGAHPMLSPELTSRSAAADNLNLIDLEARESTPVDVSPSAVLRARWFLESDPYDALDAIATSDRWRRVLEPGLAAPAAALVCLPRPGPVLAAAARTAAAALAGLADAGLSEELDAYGDELVDVIATYSPDPDVDPAPAVRAAWALNRVGQPALAATLVVSLLEWSTVPAVAARWGRLHAEEGPSSTFGWPDQEQRAHAAHVLPALLDHARPSDLPDLFALAGVLDTGVEAAGIISAADRLAAEWARRPELTDQSGGWLHRPVVVGRLRQHLARALAEQDQSAHAALATGHWDWLAPTPWDFDRQDPTAVWLGARVLAKAPPELRPRLLDELSPAAPGSAWPLFLTGEDPDLKELILWIGDHPRLDDGFAQHIQAILERDLHGQPTGRTRELLAVLAEPQVTGLNGRLSQLVQEHQWLARTWASALQAARSYNNRALRELETVSPTWLRMHRPSLANAMIYCNDRDAVAALTAKISITKSLENVLLPRLRSGDVDALIGALVLLEDGRHEHKKIVRQTLQVVWDSNTEADEQIRQRLRNRLPQGWEPRLNEFERTVTKGRVARDLARGARNFFDRGRGDG